MQYCKNLKSPKVNDVLNSEMGSLRFLSQELGEPVVEIMVVYFLSDIVNFFNVARPMNNLQIAQTAQIIIKEYPFFTPEDFNRCFYNIKAMKYGAIYEGLDGGKILSFMQRYEDDFMNEQAEFYKQENEKKRYKYQNELKQTGELLLPTLKKVVEKINQPKEAQPKPIRRLTENEVLMQSWFKEFDELYEKNPQKTNMSMQRFVFYKGKMLIQSEFINLKLEEYDR